MTDGDSNVQRSRLRSAHRDVTRTLIVDAAVRVFADTGYARATVDQIVAAAGASRATFYLHFRTKAALLPELLARSREVFDEPYERLGDTLASLDRAALRTWIGDAMRGWVQVEDLMRPVYEAATADPALYLEYFPEDLPALADMSAALAKADLAAPDRVEIYAEVLYAPLLHFFRKHLRREEFDHEVVADVIAGAWVATLTGSFGERTVAELAERPSNT